MCIRDSNNILLLLLLREFFLLIKSIRPFPISNSSIDKLCKPKLINCTHLLNNLWIKKTKKLNTNFPHFIYLPMQKSLKISPNNSSGYLTPKNSSKVALTILKSSAATSTSLSFEILSMQASRLDKAD